MLCQLQNYLFSVDGDLVLLFFPWNKLSRNRPLTGGILDHCPSLARCSWWRLFPCALSEEVVCVKWHLSPAAFEFVSCQQIPYLHVGIHNHALDSMACCVVAKWGICWDQIICWSVLVLSTSLHSSVEQQGRIVSMWHPKLLYSSRETADHIQCQGAILKCTKNRKFALFLRFFDFLIALNLDVSCEKLLCLYIAKDFRTFYLKKCWQPTLFPHVFDL